MKYPENEAEIINPIRSNKGIYILYSNRKLYLAQVQHFIIYLISYNKSYHMYINLLINVNIFNIIIFNIR